MWTIRCTDARVDKLAKSALLKSAARKGTAGSIPAPGIRVRFSTPDPLSVRRRFSTPDRHSVRRRISTRDPLFRTAQLTGSEATSAATPEPTADARGWKSGNRVRFPFALAGGRW